MTTYNGHKNYAHWNVSLWIGNDEPLYREAMRLLNKYSDTSKAARVLQSYLPERTPDGARYSFTAIKAALIGLRS